EIQYGRLEAAKAFAAANGLNRITAPTPDAWLGIAAAGKTYYDLRQALRDLGLDDPALRAHGIRLLKVGMLFPLEPGIVREFARGRARATGAGDAQPGPPAVLLLRVSPQPFDGRSRGIACLRRHRLPRARPEHGPSGRRHHPDGRGRGPVGRSRALHRHAAPLP